MGGLDQEVLVEQVKDPEDFQTCFECLAEAFGRQADDNLWISTNPGWDTPEGARKNAERMIDHWRKSDSNTLHLKATIPDDQNPASRRIVGFAIWSQISMVPGQGQKPKEWKPSDFEMHHPDDERERRYASQMLNSLQSQRRAYMLERANKSPPYVMALDICAVHPSYQRRGIASKLVQWGLGEAKRRGDLEAITEGSVRGRHVYQKLGFSADGPEIEYQLDEEFANRISPSNLFMRTGSGY
ncbi:hypothetical protein LTR84_009160 [Exophiala bonariae]|uniref:N-acetyltransferase domain-containing protein n=1 Tax=Exophiala bonariae TaxID=1690606 RepID=A0AAV9MYA0_9EURO|nr:hypothetical protein LTR84_009160 [Exophiala bonariae]